MAFIRHSFFTLLIILLTINQSLAETPEEAFVFVSPLPGSDLHLRETTLIFRTGLYFTSDDYSHLEEVSIVGDYYGDYDFNVIPSDDDFTVILDPVRIFRLSETITVTFDSVRVGTMIVDGSYSFTISSDYAREVSEGMKLLLKDEVYGEQKSNHDIPLESDLILDRDSSLPSDLPLMALLENDNPDSGYVFLANQGRDIITPYLLILDNDANPVFYKKLSTYAWDFKKQSNGLLTYILDATPYFYIMDSTYSIIDSVRAMNGYFTDEHDFQILDSGHYLIAAYDIQRVEDPGSPTAIEVEIAGYVIQELDSNKNVVFQWRSWDYLDMGHSSLTTDDSRYNDPVHGNTLELDSDGNLLTCFRNMEQFAKIDMVTGEFIWRLGGGNSDFEVIGYPQGWSRPHDIRRLDNGHITIYDNARLQPSQYSNSGPVEFELDTLAMTCTATWAYKKSERVYGPFMGNTQRLPNGNTMIGWGGRARLTATECRVDSSVAWELTFSLWDDHRVFSYRSFRFPWHGIAARPELTAEVTDSSVHLIFYKFGDTNVAYYKIYLDYQQGPTVFYDSCFANFTDITRIPGGKAYIRVTAVDNSGIESDYSNEESVLVDFVNTYLPGDVNMHAGLWPPSVNGSDVTYLVNYFRGLPLSVPCLYGDFFCSADANGDCEVIGADVTYMVNYFLGRNALRFCPDYPPVWETQDEVPAQEYIGWPPCE